MKIRFVGGPLHARGLDFPDEPPPAYWQAPERIEPAALVDPWADPRFATYNLITYRRERLFVHVEHPCVRELRVIATWHVFVTGEILAVDVLGRFLLDTDPAHEIILGADPTRTDVAFWPGVRPI